MLAQIFLQPQFSADVVRNFRKEFLCILHVAIDVKNDGAKGSSNEHVRNCVILARVLRLHPDVKRYVYKKKNFVRLVLMFFFSFAIKYFNVNPPPFEADASPNLPRKRIKADTFVFSDVDIVWACYQFLQCSVEFFRRRWNWSVFIDKYLNHSDTTVKWYLLQKIYSA